jgi:homoserine dehydrogenase
MVPKGSMIAQVEGVTNAVTIEADILGELMLSGPGAGGDATASAVLGDIADIAKSRPGHQHAPALGRPATSLSPIRGHRSRATKAVTSSRSRSMTGQGCLPPSPR